MPLSGTLCIRPVALSVIVSVPVCLVAALGVNVTEIEQPAPASRLAGQLLVSLNTPGSEIISISTGCPGCFLLPLGFDTFTVLALLGVPIVVFENLRAFGLILSVTGTGVGVAVAVAVGPPVDVAVEVCVAVDVTVGVVVAVSVGVADPVKVAVAVAVAVAVPPLVDVAVGVALAVCVAVEVAVAVAVSVEVAVAVAPVAVGVTVAVAVGVADPIDVAVAVAGGVCVGDGGPPIPDRRILVVTPWPSLSRSILPVLEPVAVGENVTFTEQVPPEASGDFETQSSVSPKSPSAETSRKLTGKLARFVTVTACGALELQTGTVPKVRVDGTVAMSGGRTVMGTITSRLPPPGAYFTSTDVVPTPTADIEPAESTMATVGSAAWKEMFADSVTSAVLLSAKVAVTRSDTEEPIAASTA